MKKYISLIMALAMVFSLAIPAAAADVTGDTSKNVTASYTPTPVTYTVTVNAAENGTVTANPAEAAEGAIVTLTVSPAKGYKLDTLAVKDASDGDVELKEDYTFVMPASNVTVTATFVEQVAPTYDVNVDADIENGNVSANKQTAEKDEEVVLTIIPAEGYELKTLTVGNVDVTADVQDGHYTITMGEAAVEVTATFTKINYTITIDSTIVNGTVTAPATATFGDSVALSVSADAKYELETLTVTRDDTDAEVTVTDKTFTMPAANVTVTATFKALPITSADIAWGSMSFTYTDGENGAADGAWSCEDGANKITVKNIGDNAFSATFTYEAKDGFDEISGAFFDNNGEVVDAIAGARLDSGETCDFYLCLAGTPAKALNDVIGEVTVKINSAPAAESAVMYVSTEYTPHYADPSYYTGYRYVITFYNEAGTELSDSQVYTEENVPVPIPDGAASISITLEAFDGYTELWGLARESDKTALPGVSCNVEYSCGWSGDERVDSLTITPIN